MLIKYLRDKERVPFGCGIALDENNLTWSLCSKHDKFSKEEAKKIAVDRFENCKKVGKTDFEYWKNWIISTQNAYLGKHPNTDLNIVLKELSEMEERSQRYFKEKEND